jgi:hypothetical protein
MKKYLLTIFGDLEHYEKQQEITISLLPIVDSPSLKFQYGKEFIIAHFESELETKEIYEFLEMFSENLYDSFILNEYDEKVSVFMSNENKEHLFNLDSDTGVSGQEMVITMNPTQEYFEDDDEEDEFTSKIITELKRQLKPPTLDQLLDKINLEGIEVLTQFEKGLLEKYSKN